jgi:myo-inositol-1(or 4)-monophosphatase
MTLEALLDTALAAAADAVSVHRAHLGKVAVERWSAKGVSDFVSYVDHEAESAIVARVRAAFPDHEIQAEEADWPAPSSNPAPSDLDPGARPNPRWIIDPLDGTTNYLHRYPAYAVSIGIAQGDELLVGVVAAGATGETWHATRGGGAFCDGRRITVSGIDDLALALIGTGFPFKALARLPEYTRQFEHVMRRTSGIRRAGSAALDLCHVASGYFDGFWELLLAPWDVAAGTLLVREAGGIVSRMDDTPDVLGHGSILAGNPAIHRALGRALAEAGD